MISSLSVLISAGIIIDLLMLAHCAFTISISEYPVLSYLQNNSVYNNISLSEAMVKSAHPPLVPDYVVYSLSPVQYHQHHFNPLCQ